ncbi:MAG: PAS domain-containing protein [Bacteriovoracaceae bacterium]
MLSHNKNFNLRRIRVFRTVTGICIIAPIIGEIAIYLATKEIGPSIYSNLLLSLLSFLIYKWYQHTKNLEFALKINSILQLTLYSWSILVSGGIRAEHFVYLPFFPVANGFLLGRKAAYASTAYAIVFTFILAFLENNGTIPFTYHSLTKIVILSVACFAFIGWIIISYESERMTSETQLKQNTKNIQNITNMMDDGFIIYNSERKVIQYNPSALRILGLTADQLFGHSPTDQGWKAIKEDGSDFPTSEHPSSLALGTGQIINGVIMGIIPPTQEPRWIRVNAFPVDHGNDAKVFVTFCDITDFKRSQTELHESHKLLNVVLDNLPAMVFVKSFDDGLRFKLMNKAGLKLIGVEENQILEKNDYDFFPKSQADFFTSKDKEVFKLAKGIKIEKEPISTPLGEKWLETRKVPTYKSDGSPDLLIGIALDITEEIDLQKALDIEKAKAIHNAKLASLGEMSAGIAHEINNPLTIISGNISLLATYRENPEKFQGKLLTMQKATDRIEKIVAGLKKFSRSSSGKEHKITPLSSMVIEALTLTEAKAKINSVQILSQIEPELEILCEEIEIEQVLVNLINNGIDAIKNLDEKWIKIVGLKRNNQVIIQVQDSGKCISKEIEEKLFEPFFTTKPIGEGTGLGLSISKGILDQHHATISLNRSFPNTCFEICFSKSNSEKEDSNAA